MLEFLVVSACAFLPTGPCSKAVEAYSVQSGTNKQMETMTNTVNRRYPELVFLGGTAASVYRREASVAIYSGTVLTFRKTDDDFYQSINFRKDF